MQKEFGTWGWKSQLNSQSYSANMEVNAESSVGDGDLACEGLGKSARAFERLYLVCARGILD